DLRFELRQAIELRFVFAPIEARPPLAHELLATSQCHPLETAGTRSLVGPSRGRHPPTKSAQIGVGNMVLERADRGIVRRIRARRPRMGMNVGADFGARIASALGATEQKSEERYTSER